MRARWSPVGTEDDDDDEEVEEKPMKDDAPKHASGWKELHVGTSVNEMDKMEACPWGGAGMPGKSRAP
eukprot:1137294-Pelagomonas_calceolata.AAC.2